jgi:hypothetical protein
MSSWNLDMLFNTPNYLLSQDHSGHILNRCDLTIDGRGDHPSSKCNLNRFLFLAHARFCIRDDNSLLFFLLFLDRLFLFIFLVA